jgi:hypothetical protein
MSNNIIVFSRSFNPVRKRARFHHSFAYRPRRRERPVIVRVFRLEHIAIAGAA